MIYNSEQPSYQILICLIKIWTMKDSNNPMDVPNNAMIISECGTIEIDESYKKLIGTASVTFPRGTVIRKTITQLNEKELNSDKSMQVSISSAGVVEEIRKTVSSAASTTSFSVGQRIRIYLGYTTDPKIADMAKACNGDKDNSIFKNISNLNEYQKHMNLMFDGYITKISVDTPVELHCENLASKLKEITCPDKTIVSKATINDFLSDDGKFNMLKGTGLTLSKATKSQNYDLGKIQLNKDLTLADVLTEWAKYGLHSFVQDGELFVGRSYFSNAKNDSIINTVSQPVTPIEILFDYHVANNGLSLTSTDKKFLAVEAEGLGADNKFFHITVLRNPEYDPTDSSKGKPYRAVNESKLSKKAMKLGLKPLTQSSDKVSMNLYTKIPYHSRKIPINRDDLYEEAIKYLESYNMNGIEGTLTLFGDLHLHTGVKVHLNDKHYPGKNGYYLVEEVNTKFGTGGYRQTIKLPYCISRDKQNSNQNE